jgi:hypothetical protein
MVERINTEGERFRDEDTLFFHMSDLPRTADKQKLKWIKDWESKRETIKAPEAPRRSPVEEVMDIGTRIAYARLEEVVIRNSMHDRRTV